MNPFAYARAANLEDAGKKVAQGGLLKAGGVDLMGRMKRGTLHPELLVDLSFVDKRTGIEDRGDRGWSIGAQVTLAELAEYCGDVGRGKRPAGGNDPDRPHAGPFAGIGEAAELTATPQIRNRATVVGNLLQSPQCWYLHDAEIQCEAKEGTGCPAIMGRNEYHAILGQGSCPVTNASNMAPVLSALDARVAYATADGGSKELALRELYRAPAKKRGFLTHTLPAGAVVQSLRIPPSRLATAHEEIRHKKSYDWALCSAGVALRLESGKIAEIHCYLGSVAPTPWHAAKAEALLRGSKPGREAFTKAAAAELAQATPLSEGTYKAKMSEVALIRALESATRRAEESQR